MGALLGSNFQTFEQQGELLQVPSIGAGPHHDDGRVVGIEFPDAWIFDFLR